ncbi:MAG: hypothetical protein KDC79_05490 [Cyclobacteriaceae bacterium]|nr:hypothetical protein [Cyclobacteriaceae bacterium]
MNCSSKKVCYSSPEEVREALLQARSKYRNGPVSFYKCEFCGAFHLTSKGNLDESVLSDENIKRIERESEARTWEERFKKK